MANIKVTDAASEIIGTYPSFSTHQKITLQEADQKEYLKVCLILALVTAAVVESPRAAPTAGGERLTRTLGKPTSTSARDVN